MSFFVNTMVCGFSLYQILAFFLIYSCLGWCLEVIYAAVSTGQLVNRGFLNGPVCPIYGFGMIIVLFALTPLQHSILLLYIGGVILPSALELVGGWALYKLYHTRWWDYSYCKWNLDGYICLSASVVWGALGLVTVKWLVPLLMRLYQLVPAGLAHVLLWIFAILLVIDLLGTALTLGGLRYKLPRVDEVNNRLASLTLRMGLWIFDRTERRMRTKAPQLDLIRPKRTKSTVFAAGCSFYKIFLLFVIGAFLGDITETIFCRITAGYWMSRSSLVWGPFSIVWGLAIALVTQVLYKYKDRSAFWLFGMGTLLGGAYEYLCSVFTELVFGKVFWDYSWMPFNLGGRINLLYCFFWGIAAVVWFKILYPKISGLIEKIPVVIGKTVTWMLIVFMCCNVVVSCMALIRYDERGRQVEATQSWQVYMDEHYDDAKMAHIYPNAKTK